MIHILFFGVKLNDEALTNIGTRLVKNIKNKAKFSRQRIPKQNC